MLKTPIKLVDSSSLNRLSNSVNIASDMRIAVNDGYILKVKQQGVEVSGGTDPYDTEEYYNALLFSEPQYALRFQTLFLMQ